MPNPVLISPDILRALIKMSNDQIRGRTEMSGDLDLPARKRAIAAAETLYGQSEIAHGDLSLVPCIATCHISLETNNLLEAQGDQNPWCYCGTYEHGFWLSVPIEDTADLMAQSGSPAPADLLELWTWARERGHGWIRLDADGLGIDCLPEYTTGVTHRVHNPRQSSLGRRDTQAP